MNAQINTFQMNVGNREFLLADVSKSSGLIGTLTFTGTPPSQYERPHTTTLFYVENEAIINLTRPPKGDEFTDKIVHQISSLSVCDEKIKTILSAVSDNYFTYSQSMSKSLQPVFEILSEGIYVCYEAKMIPSNGSRTFFWSAYAVRYELQGSSEYNSSMGRDSNYVPCFLIPTTGISEFSDTKIKAQREKLNTGKKVGGLAYHVSGLFSALLDGHHSATACLLNDMDFRCLVIEPLRDVLYESAEQAAEYGRNPKIAALSCPYVKIPISMMPPMMLESFLLRRSQARPRGYMEIKKQANKTLKMVSRRNIDRNVLLKAELLPDRAVIESAHSVSGLSDEQLQALLNGETRYEDKIIVSNNYYNSVVTACNYLQYEDFDRFLNFASAIINNPNLTATHKYIIERLCAINDEKINDFFVELAESGDAQYAEHIPSIESYIKNYSKYVSDNLIEQNKRIEKINQALKSLDSEMDSSNIEKMESIVKNSKKDRIVK